MYIQNAKLKECIVRNVVRNQPKKGGKKKKKRESDDSSEKRMKEHSTNTPIFRRPNA